MASEFTYVQDGIPFGYELGEDHQLLRDGIRDFARNVAAPGAMERDIKGEFPADIVKQLGEMGYMGICIPEKFGGAGLDALASAIVVEELSYADASLGVINSVQNSLVVDPIVKYGTDAQKQEWLPKMARGECLNCFSLSEAGSGSDAGAMSCRANLEGDEWVINGTKLWVTNGAEADLILLFVRTEDGDKRNSSALLVPKKTPGLTVGKHEDKLGIRGSSTTELIFDNCRVPASNLLGERGRGLNIALTAIDGGRLGIAAQALGIAQACLDRSVDYARERKQFGSPIGDFQAIQWKIADMSTRIAVARALLYKGCWLKMNGAHSLHIPAMAKVWASETASFCANQAIQIFGGMGYCREGEVERYLRDAKITEIYEGTSEMQRQTIALSLIKEPERITNV
ncbi:MAG: acyl-CoA dehydrogenase family protein [Phycisphaerales bacterium]|nr:acyl-CoA dehydrogenase family protein [Phycisphaerales bacterium]MCB9855674.1 acyl-CoA dehydrogenase family protein [Phycisphaerales bacterium]MCB9862569.1 acyl-CoA dehydrogenase family protein [Phycisphaerales bacterium]